MSGRPFSAGGDVRRVCLLSGGGDAPGVKAVVRAFVHAAHRRSVEVLGSRYGFEGLLDPVGITPITLAEVRGILPKGSCVLGCSTRINPFFLPAKTGTGTESAGPAIVDRLRSLDVDGLVLMGGDGTMLAARRFTALGMPCLGIPKTIDSDLADTDLSCGFHSAVYAATHAIDALHSTAEAHARVMIMEVMGRHAGFIALHAGVAGGADVILIPELPYGIEPIVAKIREREGLGLRFSMVVIAEGATPRGDTTASEIEGPRPGRLARLGGAGARLADELVHAELGHEIRLTVLSHLQRGGSPSALDRALGTQLGAHALDLCAAGAFGRMLSIRDGRIASVAFADGRSLHRSVDIDGPLIASARTIGVTFG